MRNHHTKLTLGELCDFVNGNGFRPPDWSSEGLPIIRIQNLNGSREFNYFRGKPKEKWIIRPGDILFAWAGVKGVSFGPTIWNGPTGVLNQHIFRIIPRAEVNRYWLYAALRLVTQRIEARAHGFKASLLHVQKGEITDQTVDVPPLSEQHQIAALLHTWDEAIETTERLYALKRVRLRSSEQRLFNSNNSKWPHVPLNQIAERIRRKSDGEVHPIMTISGKSGFLRQDQKFNRFMAGESVENYTLLKAGEFAYNKGNSKTYPQGCIYRLDQQSALVPHVYISFRLVGGVNGDFYAHLFQAGFLNRQLARLINSGVRNDGLLNLNIDDFFSCELPLPPMGEQSRIADFFGTARRELAVIEKQIPLLKRQSRGLLQKLLSGEWQPPSRVINFKALSGRTAQQAAL